MFLSYRGLEWSTRLISDPGPVLSENAGICVDMSTVAILHLVTAAAQWDAATLAHGILSSSLS
jgi:hypothetical protein